MRLPYSAPELDEDTRTLAKTLVEIIINTGVSYKKAEEALEEAQRLIRTETKPTLSV